MALRKMLSRLLSLSVLLLASLPLHASTPVWTFSAPTPAHPAVSNQDTIAVQYTVTNHSRRPKNLLMQPIPGVHASSCELAGKGSTCILTLTINGREVSSQGLHQGPVLCNRGNINQCYRPSRENILHVDKVYTLGGTVSNLVGTVVLENSNGDIIPINANDSFSFPKKLYSQSSFKVTVKSQPEKQQCTVNNGSGQLATSDVNTINVSCIDTRSLSGIVSGLDAGESITIESSSGESLTVGGDSGGTFNFIKRIAQGENYFIKLVSASPPGKRCTLGDRTSGKVGESDIANITIECEIIHYSIGGTVNGLSGTLKLKNSINDEEITISSNGAFTFPEKQLLAGDLYNVSIETWPANQTCSLTNGSGNIDDSNITNIEVDCKTQYSVGGTVTGLGDGESIVLNNSRNGGDPEGLSVNENGIFTFDEIHYSEDTYAVSIQSSPDGKTCTVTDGDGNITNSNITNISVQCENTQYTVGGSVSDLSGTLELTHNGSETLTLTADGGFEFVGQLISGDAYEVTITSQPETQTCTVSNGSGNITNSNITNISVQCENTQYTVGGSVSDLSGTLELTHNGSETLTLTADGGFEFDGKLISGDAYEVTITSQPETQTCTVSNGSGNITNSNITNISVQCENTQYTVGGTVSDLSGTLELTHNGSETLTLTADGGFEFDGKLISGDAYEVTITSQPETQTCTVSNGSGNITNSNITNISVQCENTQYTVGGSVSDLSGTLELTHNGSETLTLTADGGFEFDGKLISGDAYEVTITSQPETQTCTVSNGSGNITNSNITNISVQCENTQYTVGGTVSGLGDGDSVTLNNHRNGAGSATDTLIVNANGNFTLNETHYFDDTYAVSVQTSPAGKSCSVTSNASGTVSGSVSNVTVECELIEYTVGGTVSGLGDGDSVTLDNHRNGAGSATDTLIVNANGNFTLNEPHYFDDTYAVSVQTSPAGKSCSVTSNASGTISGSVSNVTVECELIEYTVGGTVSGLGDGDSVTLDNHSNGSGEATDTLTVNANGNFTLNETHYFDDTYAVSVQTSPAGKSCSVTSNASGTISGSVSNVTVECELIEYTVGGTVSGLGDGDSVTLNNHSNGSGEATDTLIVNANGNFTLNEPHYFDDTYAVSVQTSPAGKSCSVTSNASGTISGSVSNVTVECELIEYTVGGTVSGLGDGDSVTLNNHSNGSGEATDTLTVNANGNFTLNEPHYFDDTYAVSVQTSPAGKSCSVTSNASGTISGSVSNVTVECELIEYTVGGTVSGLGDGDSVTLNNYSNGSGEATDTLTVNANGNFTLNEPHYFDSTYAVSVQTSPAGKSCSVTSNASGTISGSVSNVTVECELIEYTVGGTVSGLGDGDSVTLNNHSNGSGEATDTLTVNANGNFTLNEPHYFDSTYAVSVQTSPAGKSCSVTSNASGTISGSVSNVTVECELIEYTVGGTVSGLGDGDSVTLNNHSNGSGEATDTLTVNANGNFTLNEPHYFDSTYAVSVQTSPAGKSCSVTSNASGTISGSVSNVTVECELIEYTVGGTVSGLGDGDSVTLNNYSNGSGEATDTLTVNANGNFTLNEPHYFDSTYAVSVQTSPAGKSCSVTSNASGTISGSVSNVTVECELIEYTVGGTVSGLGDGDSVTLNNHSNGSGEATDTLTVNANGNFTLNEPHYFDSTYAVSVQTSPAGKSCSVTSNASGTISGSVSNVTVECELIEYTVGGTVSGLGDGDSVTLNNHSNGSGEATDTLTVNANGNFTLNEPHYFDSTYAVSVQTSPAGKSCSVTSNASGTISGSVSNVTVECELIEYTVGGTVSGLGDGDSVTLNNHSNGSGEATDTLTVNANGNFTLNEPHYFDSTYAVSVQTSPAGKSCSVTSNASGTISGSVSNVTVECELIEYTVGGTVSGLGDGDSVTLDNHRNGAGSATDTLIVNANGNFTLNEPHYFDDTYAVSVQTSPAGKSCSVTSNASGTISGSVSNVTVECELIEYTVGGTVSGLGDGDSVTLNNHSNGSGEATDTLTVNANGNFTLNEPHYFDSTYAVSVQTSPAGKSCSVTSNASGTISGSVSNVTVECELIEYTVGGTVSGLGDGDSVTLNNHSNGSGEATDTLTVNANGNFTLNEPHYFDSTYAVSVQTSPAGKSCSVTSNASGTISGSVSNVTVECELIEYTVGGTVSGLGDGDSVTLDNHRNGAGSATDTLIVNANGNFTLNEPHYFDDTYAVSVQTSPAGKSCSVTSNASGTISGSVSNVTVECELIEYTVGGTVSGLGDGDSVTLNNHSNGSGEATDTLTVNANGNFTLNEPHYFDSTYAVSVQTSPAGKSCTVINDSGTISGSVNDVEVECFIVHSVGGTVSGLGEGESVTLETSTGETMIVDNNAGNEFDFLSPQGEEYSVTITSPPPGKTCSIENGVGMLGDSDITNLNIICSSNAYTVGGNISGLSGTVTLQNKGSDNLVRGADGYFVFSESVAQGASYDVRVHIQPGGGLVCSVLNGKGTIEDSGIIDVQVICTTPHTIGGNVTGLSGSVMLQNNGEDYLVLETDGLFTFEKLVAEGTSYDVKVFIQPDESYCSVNNGSGIANSDISDIAVICATPYTVGGTATGLTGTLIVQNKGSDDLKINGNGDFTFPQSVADGGEYEATVLTPPEDQNCVITNGSGVISGSNVSNINITCEDHQATLAASTNHLALSVTGLDEKGYPSVGSTTSSGEPRIITITNNGPVTAENLSISEPTMPSGTVMSNDCPASLLNGQTCTITITPGGTATSDGVNPCSNGTNPIPAVIKITSSNANTVSTDVVILNYGCIYQGGFVFALDDNQGCDGIPCDGSVGGKVISMEHQGSSQWSPRNDYIWGTGYWSNAGSPTPNISHGAVQYAGQNNCRAIYDGACNSNNAVIFYSRNDPGDNLPLDFSEYTIGKCHMYQFGGFGNWYLPALCEIRNCGDTSNVCGKIPGICGPSCNLGDSCLINQYDLSSQAATSYLNDNNRVVMSDGNASNGSKPKSGYRQYRCVRKF